MPMVFAHAQKVSLIFLEGSLKRFSKNKLQLGQKGAIFEIFTPFKSKQLVYAYGTRYV